MKIVMIAAMFLFFGYAANAQTDRMSKKGKTNTTRVTKGHSYKKLKSKPDPHSGAGLDNTGTTAIHLPKDNSLTKSDKNKPPISAKKTNNTTPKKTGNH